MKTLSYEQRAHAILCNARNAAFALGVVKKASHRHRLQSALASVLKDARELIAAAERTGAALPSDFAEQLDTLESEALP